MTPINNESEVRKFQALASEMTTNGYEFSTGWITGAASEARRKRRCCASAEGGDTSPLEGWRTLNGALAYANVNPYWLQDETARSRPRAIGEIQFSSFISHSCSRAPSSPLGTNGPSSLVDGFVHVWSRARRISCPESTASSTRMRFAPDQLFGAPITSRVIADSYAEKKGRTHPFFCAPITELLGTAR